MTRAQKIAGALALNAVAMGLGIYAPAILALNLIAVGANYIYSKSKQQQQQHQSPPNPQQPLPEALPKLPENYSPYQEYVNLYNNVQRLKSPYYVEFYPTIVNVLSRYRIVIDQRGLLAFDQTATQGLQYTPAQAKRIAQILLQMAKDLPDDKLSDKFMCAQKGIFYILKAFVKLYPTDDIIKIKHEYLMYCRKILSQLNSPKKSRTPDEAATFIQRAFRKNQYIKHSANKPDLDPKSFKLFTKNPKLQTFLTPETPAKIKHLDGAQKKAWVKRKQHEIQYANLIAESVTYRSFEQFLGKLKVVVKDFNGYLHSLPAENRDYILVVPQQHGSNRWVTALALKYLRHEPVDIVEAQNVKAYVQANPRIKYTVYMDDALYSGRQMCGLLQETHCKLPQIVIAPYYQSSALVRIGNSVVKFIAEKMMTPLDLMRADLWSKHQMKIFEDLVPDHQWSNASYKSGVYFQHRMADKASVYLATVNEKYNDLLPEVPSRPYLEKP